MAATSQFKTLVQDQLQELGEVQIRPIFGGAGVFYNALMFGLIADDELFLKVDDGNRQDFKDAGMAPFTYLTKKRSVTMSYYRMPDHVFEDRQQLCEWAEKAIAAALRKKA